ncbi:MULTISPECIES: type VI secretion system ATPase TssH [unclassified Pseudomonas]|uniref:type VI secretion system ATPase TssH n=1 Tax=unclassified Pseudomonas TaxID=196821 RepID=UPI000871992C|nr:MULTISPECIES: type VI secretion system ATPase TssH [unclassified Pseudomonas]SCW42947.1 type VI secretion system protein VasG [Pseudomonas sp. NFACC05-1]SCZ40727.1 type VI secretion system protein VasG [Pseudomonas sp. NFACC44-2]SDA55532.1 type VI secretion system protein VasG [Pseudomonas sp. NFACC51]SDW10676.1 type VI secretion system protein VasG [Pseudomonas sp. NFACC08-1]SEJ94334.1 type VI secretion system protein VasG [Pseudomonas sp. NFACC07-1]
MGEISRAALFGKLNSVAYKAIEAATVFCKLRGNPYVELAHWFHQLLQLQDSDLHRIIRQFNIEPARLARDLTEALDRLPRGSTSITDLSSHVEEAVERGWVYGSLMFGESQVRTGYLVLGILKTPSLRHALLGLSSEFDKVKVEALSERFDEYVGDSPENALTASDGFNAGAVPGEASGAMAPSAMGKQEALKRFTVDLTEQARSGKLDPIVGRDEEIRQLVDILMRRRQNNPILTGEAGVGKTAVVEGFALRIVAGDVPPALKDVELRSLDVGLLQAGASMKGEFEQRLRQVIEDVQASPKPIILFIDEAHTLVGAGGAAGTGDAANLLKPALARGTLRTVAATTWAEYKKHIEKDPALTRRFQVVQVAEPSEDKALLMMRGVASTMEKHHQVQILDEALEASVKLSHRYIPARQLPDKSVSLLDTACARVAISLHAVPAEVDDSRRRIEALETELQIIAREHAIGVVIGTRQTQTESLLSAERERLAELESRWAEEKTLVDELLATRATLRERVGVVDSEDASEAADNESHALREKLVDLQQRLTALQGETPLILPTVDYQAVASVVADWTGIPVGRMARNELETVLNLDQHLKKRIIGQDHALQMIAKRIQTSRAGLDNPSKPIGVFMLAGTSGVGKTETALALAEAMYGGEQNVITINMSEFQEAHTVSTLKGAPPGYIGYGEGGVLTEAVRRKPYSVVLLDEVEKAHPDVHEIFFQVFDKGVMEDGEGRVIDFKNTLILLTTNAGTELIADVCKDPQNVPEPEEIAKALRQPLLEIFPPALLGRLVTIPYYPLSDEMLKAITRLQLNRIKKRVESTHKVAFDYDDAVIDLIVSRCTETESGGRMIDTILTNSLLPDMSREFLTRMLEGKALAGVRISAVDNELQYDFSDAA